VELGPVAFAGAAPARRGGQRCQTRKRKKARAKNLIRRSSYSQRTHKDRHQQPKNDPFLIPIYTRRRAAEPTLLCVSRGLIATWSNPALFALCAGYTDYVCPGLKEEDRLGSWSWLCATLCAISFVVRVRRVISSQFVEGGMKREQRSHLENRIGPRAIPNRYAQVGQQVHFRQLQAHSYNFKQRREEVWASLEASTYFI
jgi:hypothetical protein